MKQARSKASEKIAKRIRDLRHEASLTRRELADYANMDVSHLARIEAGSGNPTLFVLIQLATALETTPDALIVGMESGDLPQDVRPFSRADFLREKRRRDAL